MSLLCVLTASPRTLADVHLLSRRMLAMRASADALLALCDLPDAFAAVMPEDEPLLRALQSAVMAADARAGRFLLLVRRRVWDDASRLYLGESQPISPVQTVSTLLDTGFLRRRQFFARVSGGAVFLRALLSRGRLLCAGRSSSHVGRFG